MGRSSDIMPPSLPARYSEPGTDSPRTSAGSGGKVQHSAFLKSCVPSPKRGRSVGCRAAAFGELFADTTMSPGAKFAYRHARNGRNLNNLWLARCAHILRSASGQSKAPCAVRMTGAASMRAKIAQRQLDRQMAAPEPADEQLRTALSNCHATLQHTLVRSGLLSACCVVVCIRSKTNKG